MSNVSAICPIEELARDLGVDPRELIRDLGEREAAMFAGMYHLQEASTTKRPSKFLPLSTPKSGEFATVGASIPDDLFGILLNRGKEYGLKQMLDAQDLRPVLEEFPMTRTETVSGKIVSGYGGRGGRWAGTKRVKFDNNVGFAK